MNLRPQYFILKKYKDIEIRYKAAFFSAIICGLCAHLYQFTNKFFNFDELFHTPEGTGEGLALGRWGLFYLGKFVKHFFGNYSLPLVNGIVSLILIAFAACAVVKSFEVKSGILAGIIGGLFAVFPSVICNFFFMYTSPYYSAALMLACISAMIIVEGFAWWRCIMAVLLLCFATGIYQAYFPVGVCIVLGSLILRCQDGINSRGNKSSHENEKENIESIIKQGVGYVLYLLLSLVLYLLVNKLSLKIFKVDLPDYQGMADMGKIDILFIMKRAIQSYSHFVHLTYTDVYRLNPTSLFKLCTALLFVVAGFVIIGTMFGKATGERKNGKSSISVRIIYLLLLLIYPIALFLIFSMSTPQTYVQEAMLNAVLFAFIMPICMWEHFDDKGIVLGSELISVISGWIAVIAGVVMILVYIWWANGNYQVLQYVNYHDIAYYETMMTQIKSVDGYDESLPVIILGNKITDSTNGAGGLISDKFTTYGKSDSNINAYSSNNIFTKYLGFTPDFLWSDEDQEKYANNPAVIDMTCYPKDGSIGIVDGAIVVKLQEKDEWLNIE